MPKKKTLKTQKASLKKALNPKTKPKARRGKVEVGKKKKK